MNDALTTWHEKLLGQALGELLIELGVYEDVGLDGPQLLAGAKDALEMVRRERSQRADQVEILRDLMRATTVQNRGLGRETLRIESDALKDLLNRAAGFVGFLDVVTKGQ